MSLAYGFEAEPLPNGIAASEITQSWAWDGGTGKGVKVAVIDSGVDAAHPDVGAVQGYVSFNEDEDGISVCTDPHDDSYGHGTACAGIIRKASPECEIYSVKVLGAGLSGKGTIFAEGLKWAVENGMHVCNMSLGTTKKDYYARLHELADEGYFRRVVLVTAANNMPVPSFPSMYASVIAVSSHSSDDPFLIFSNPRPPVEFSAFGVDVRVAWINGGHIQSTGNSYAAPHVAGMVARILGKHPGLTVFQVKTVLHALSANVGRDIDKGRA